MWGKGENAGIQHFLLFPQFFYLSQNKFQFFSHIYSQCFQFRPLQNMSFGKEIPENFSDLYQCKMLSSGHLVKR